MKTFSYRNAALLASVGLGLFLAGCNTSPQQDAAQNSAATNSVATPLPVPKDLKPTNPDDVIFMNSPQGLSGKLKENYVDFWFEYPKTWNLKSTGDSPDDKNFVKVEREIADQSKGRFTVENFAVGYFKSSGNDTKDALQMPLLIKKLSAQYAKGFPNYKKMSEGDTKIGQYHGRQFLFKAQKTDTSRGPITMWGRIVLLPNPKTGDNHGVALVMLASSLSKDVKDVHDVGVKGELPIILKSFKMNRPE